MFLQNPDNSDYTRPMLKVALVLAVFLGGYLLGRSSFNEVSRQLVASDFERAALDEQNREISAELNTLVQEKFSNQETINHLKVSLADIRVERSRENEELKLYRNLSKGGENITGLAINPVTLIQTEEGEHRLLMTLTQPRARRRVTGKLELSVKGTDSQGKAGEVAIQELLGNHPDDASFMATSQMDAKPGSATVPEFDFRYFQRFRFSVTLPDGFNPEHVQITANPAKRHQPAVRKVSRSIPWKVATSVNWAATKY